MTVIKNWSADTLEYSHFPRILRKPQTPRQSDIKMEEGWEMDGGRKDVRKSIFEQKH